VIYIALAIAGIIAQIRMVESLRASIRSSWTDAGGRQLRKTP
jgi:hypothetical protein